MGQQPWSGSVNHDVPCKAPCVILVNRVFVPSAAHEQPPPAHQRRSHLRLATLRPRHWCRRFAHIRRPDFHIHVRCVEGKALALSMPVPASQCAVRRHAGGLQRPHPTWYRPGFQEEVETVKFTFSLGLSGRMGVGVATPTCSAFERVASTTCGDRRVRQLIGRSPMSR